MKNLPTIHTIQDAVEPSYREDIHYSSIEVDVKHYVPPSLQGFTDEFIPFKKNKDGRDLYTLINLETIPLENTTATKNANRYLQRYLSNSKHTNNVNSSQHQYVPLYLCIAEKKLGREPGFESLRLDDAFWSALAMNFSAMKNHKLKQYLDFSIDDENFKIKFINLLNNNKSFAADFSQYVILENNNLPQPFIIWRFKQDYNEPNVLGNVGPKGRLKKPRREENLNALREVINNDISTEMGYNTQVQQLKLSSYQDGHLKFLTVNQLASNYQDLSKAYKLTGDKNDPHIKKGLFHNFLTKLGSRFGAKTQNPPYLGTLLSMQLFLEDPDFIGAYGQNKGLKDGEIFMIDLAKGLRGSRLTKISDSLQDNGHFQLSIESLAKSPFDPFNLSRHFLFRNSTMLYDVPFSENMMGFHILNQFVNGHSDAKIIKSFGPEFEAKFSRVQPNGLHKIFQKHIDNLFALKQKVTSKKDKEEINHYIREVKKTRNIAVKNAREILQVFQSRLKLTAQEIDLLSNLEKITSDTYDLTDDKRTQISHLQVHSKSRIPWELEPSIDSNWITLRCDLTKNPLLGNADRKKVISAFESLNQFLNDTSSNILDLNKLVWEKSGKSAYISINRSQLETLSQTDITDRKVHDYKVPLHSSESILETTNKAIQSYRALYYTEKYATSGKSHSKFGFFTKKTDSPTYDRLIISYYNNFFEMEVTNRNEQNIFKLIATLGLLTNKNNLDLTKHILNSLKIDSLKTAKSRIMMQLINELLILNPNLTNKEIASFTKPILKQLKAYNTAIKKKQSTKKIVILERNLIIEISTWFRENIPTAVNRPRISS